MARIIGIDLGTTNCAVSLYEHGKVKIIPIAGKNTTPSVIYFGDDGVTVGHEAKRRIALTPEKILKSTKRDIGSTVTYNMAGRSITPVMAASLILKYLKTEAEKYLNDSLDNVVITVPAYFGFEERNLTKEAAVNAGWNPLAVLEEPTAAAVSCGVGKKSEQTYVVVDLGGGTFDVTVLEYKFKDGRSVFSPLKVGGDKQLGGDDFDNAIVKYLISEGATGFKSELELKEFAEQAKIDLSQSNEVSIDCKFIDIVLNLDTYKRIVDDYLNTINNTIKSTVQGAGKSFEDIDRFILVGGSCKHPVVRDSVTTFIGREPHAADNLDTVVAEGAALYHHSLKQIINEDDDPITPEGIIIETICPKTLGTDVVTNDEVINAILVKEGHEIPCKVAHFATVNEGQKELLSKVIEGKERLVEDKGNTELGNIHIQLQYKDSIHPIITVFDIDKSGCLTFTTYEVPMDKHSCDAIIKLSESTNESGVINWESWMQFKKDYPKMREEEKKLSKKVNE